MLQNCISFNLVSKVSLSISFWNFEKYLISKGQMIQKVLKYPYLLWMNFCFVKKICFAKYLCSLFHYSLSHDNFFVPCISTCFRVIITFLRYDIYPFSVIYTFSLYRHQIYFQKVCCFLISHYIPLQFLSSIKILFTLSA